MEAMVDSTHAYLTQIKMNFVTHLCLFFITVTHVVID